MSYSPNLKLAYVHVPKTGGTSVANFLQQLNNNELLTYTSTFTSNWFGHCLASDIETEIGSDKYDEYYTFATARDPFSLHSSLFRFYQHVGYDGNAIVFRDFFDEFSEKTGGKPMISHSYFINRPVKKIYALTEINQLFADLNKMYEKTAVSNYLNVTKVESWKGTELDEIIKDYGDKLDVAIKMFKDDVIWLIEHCPEAVKNILPLYPELNIPDAEIKASV